MKRLGIKTARLWRNSAMFVRGVMIGVAVVIGLNSYGYVIKIGVIPSTIELTREAMK